MRVLALLCAKCLWLVLKILLLVGLPAGGVSAVQLWPCERPCEDGDISSALGSVAVSRATWSDQMEW